MQKLTLKSKDRDYDIICGRDIIKDFSEYFRIDAQKICIITDSNVAPLYLETLKKSFSGFAGEVYQYVFPAGEGSKTLATCAEVYNFLASNSFSRTDALIALGGGVTGDLTGFIASTFLRGIKFYSVPTTLLAQVDSSVGGKCGVDIMYGKNLVGSFYQPYGVLVDVNAVNTLPESVYADGMAEVIKYGFIYDKALYEKCASHTENLFDIIVRCIDIKREVVESDEFDNGIRMILNYGHTIGHAVESLGEYSLYSHGQAVAIGMCYAARLSEILGAAKIGLYQKITAAVGALGLPTQSKFTADEILPVLLSDKKMRSGKLNFILLKDIGHSEIYKIDRADIEVLLEKVIGKA